MFNLQPYTSLPCARHIRTYIGDQLLADSKHVRLYLDVPVPKYIFPQSDVRMDLLVPSEHTVSDTLRGKQIFWHIKNSNNLIENGAFTYTMSDPSDDRDHSSYVTFVWNKMDRWYEEEVEIFVHARNPYVRVDTALSSRQLRIEIDNFTLADTGSPVLLWETGLPTRFYISRSDIDMKRLIPSQTRTRCPYKGIADTFHIQLDDHRIEDCAWIYKDPLPACAQIRDKICFYNEVVDIFDGGIQQPQPNTQFK
ncbi:MAG: DUF427 domain-containing protein [Methyloligellaceae bacterium]